MANNRDSSVTFEFINRILLEYTPEYHNIIKIAERDVGQDLLDKINEFLEDRKKVKPVEELKQVVFEDASKVTEEDINDIVDAFVKFRSVDTLAEIDRKSIDDIMILFNQWVAIGRGQQEKAVPTEAVFEFKPVNMLGSGISALEEQIKGFQGPRIEELYGSHFFETKIAPLSGMYSNPSDIYQDVVDVEFTTGRGEDVNDSVYTRKAAYKWH
ncbi:hypothetical protein JXC34_01665 [Candidatus Woesearchaeota archaeon]|nr:hypothetical protein [Candidatus Woesearchaeota archaeon]